MKRNSIFLVNSTHKTKTWWMFLSVLLFVVVPFIIVWVLVGEFNMLDVNWLVAKNASVWHGTITQENVEILCEKYFIFFDGTKEVFKQELTANIGKTMEIISYKTFFNPIILAPIFGVFVWTIIWPIVFNAIKLQGLDVLPFSVGFGAFMMVFIISALIPQWENLLVLYYLVRLLIGIVIGVVLFICSNIAVNKYLANKPYGADIIFGYKISDADKAPAKEQLKQNIDILKQQDDTYIDVPVEEGK